MGTICVNGKTYTGRNVQVVGSKVIIDGVEQKAADEVDVKIEVTGNIETLEVSDGEIKVVGIVNEISSKNADILIQGDVGGSILSANGDIDCGNVNGSINTTNGDVKHR